MIKFFLVGYLCAFQTIEKERPYCIAIAQDFTEINKCYDMLEELISIRDEYKNMNIPSVAEGKCLAIKHKEIQS